MARHRCDCCGVALENVGDLRTVARCGACLRTPPAFNATVVACDYTPPMDSLALALKFGGRLELAPLLAQMLQQAIGSHTQLGQHHALPELLTVVPLGPRRLVERGFNQSLEIAKPLSRSLGIALAARLLQRTRDTQAQALLHPDERHRNIRNAFIVRGAAADRVRGRHIGVIDDIMTTGETLNELAATLKRFGAARVTNFVFARTLPN